MIKGRRGAKKAKGIARARIASQFLKAKSGIFPS